MWSYLKPHTVPLQKQSKESISKVTAVGSGVLPVVHYVCDDGGEEAEQHDRRAGIHDRVQKLPGVLGERQHLLQIDPTKRDGESSDQTNAN